MGIMPALAKLSNFQDMLSLLEYRSRSPLGSFKYRALMGAAENYDRSKDDEGWTIVHSNTPWGSWEMNFLLTNQFTIPREWNSNLPIGLYLPIGAAEDFNHPEALVYLDDQPFAACDRYHQEIILPGYYHDGRQHALTLHGWTGPQHWYGSDTNSNPVMGEPAIVLIDPPTRNLLALLRVASGVLRSIDPNCNTFLLLLRALECAYNNLDLIEPIGEQFYYSVKEVVQDLQINLKKAGNQSDGFVCAIGQSHIDLAWLWTVEQTRLKAGRSFHTVLHLMDQFPEYNFTQSQPQLYAYVQQDYPELFASIQEKVAKGNWELVGGMWVEADCNLSGPEALVRQLLLGRTFFRHNFGINADSPVLWLPDTFGFPWSLPQLLAQSGLKYFLTIKMGWNDTNRIPFDSFWWQGLDGTRILTHFGSNECNVPLDSEQIIKAWDKYPQKYEHQEIAMLFGWGDGGGGATREMLENRRLLEDFPSTPCVKPERIGEFFARLESTSSANLPDWQDELYLERHRGVYTTHGQIKRANRKSEFLLHDVEFLASFASLLDPDFAYPHQALKAAWELVCLNQFHDILSGSSIGEVYVDAHQDYNWVREAGNQFKENALESISYRLGGDYVVVNPIGFNRSDLVLLPAHLPKGKTLTKSSGAPVLVQEVDEGTWIDVDQLPPFSITTLHLTDTVEEHKTHMLSVSINRLENDQLCVLFTGNGEIQSLRDKLEGREIIPAGMVSNQLLAFEDRPVDSDAWELDADYANKPLALDGEVSIEVIEAGPLRATIQVKRQIFNSQIIQKISLSHNSPRLDFDTFVDWRERHVLLKVAFPVNILSPYATYDIQWGCIQRPTHRNTSWDQARFEVCAHKWVDLSEDGYGVSLMNDCKYGHDVHGNVIRLSLLRSPTSPDPEADQGEHHFQYSLLPHSGDWRNFTIPESYALNDPVIVYQPKNNWPPGSLALISTDAPNIVIETIKAAEDANGLIFRLYEAHRRRGPVMLNLGFDVSEAWYTNLLEQNQAKINMIKNDQVLLDIKPFEIISLRLMPKGSLTNEFIINQER